MERCALCGHIAKEGPSWRVTHGGQRVSVHLCAFHSEPLEEILGSQGRHSGITLRADRVASIQEIEQLKAATLRASGDTNPPRTR